MSRVARDLTGGEENAQVPARVTVRAAGRRRQLVKRVAATVNRPPQDAEVEFPSLEKVDAKEGIAVDGRAAASGRAGADRAGREPPSQGAGRASPSPKITREELAKKYPVILVADRPTSSCASTSTCGW